MTRAEGIAHITETVFENRFMHVQELNRLGAKIKLDGREGNRLVEQSICKRLLSWRRICALVVSLVIAALLSCSIGGKGRNNRQSCLSS